MQWKNYRFIRLRTSQIADTRLATDRLELKGSERNMQIRIEILGLCITFCRDFQ